MSLFQHKDAKTQRGKKSFSSRIPTLEKFLLTLASLRLCVKKKQIFFLITFLFLCTGCGYQFGGGSMIPSGSTISVPYAEGDLDGNFTTELIKRISTVTKFRYQRTAASLILKVRLLDFYDENIGFRYYRNKKNHLTKETIPVETRLYVTAEVSLIDATNGTLLLSPVLISASTDFDHDYYSTKDAINVFSLGQLTDYDEALDAAHKPLYHKLSKKIVDYLSDSW